MQFQQRWTKSLLTSAVLVAVAAMSGTAAAGTATSNLAVSASVSNNCTIDASTGTVAFGAYDPIVTNKTTNLTAAGSVSTTCTNGASVTLSLGEGTNKGGTSTPTVPIRRMIAGTNYLSYQLYSDSAHTAVFNSTGVSVTGTGAAVSTPVYGVVTAGQNVPTGSYADTVVATVTF